MRWSPKTLSPSFLLYLIFLPLYQVLSTILDIWIHKSRPLEIYLHFNIMQVTMCVWRNKSCNYMVKFCQGNCPLSYSVSTTNDFISEISRRKSKKKIISPAEIVLLCFLITRTQCNLICSLLYLASKKFRVKVFLRSPLSFCWIHFSVYVYILGKKWDVNFKNKYVNNLIMATPYFHTIF